MSVNQNRISAFSDMLGLTLMSAGMKFPLHHLLVRVIINTMALMVVSGERTRFHGTTIVNDILSVSEEIMALNVSLNINVAFRFKNILEVPFTVILDGHIIGFESFNIYFKNRSVPTEELERAQVLFNFLAIVRHFSYLLGPRGIAELIQELNNVNMTSSLASCQGRGRGRGHFSTAQMIHTVDKGSCTTSVGPPISRDTNRPLSVTNPNKPVKRYNPMKRHARILNDENGFPIVQKTRHKPRPGFF